MTLSACYSSGFVEEPGPQLQQEQNLVKSLVMRGSDSTAAIAADSYEERAPLVMPSSATAALPTPVQPEAATAASDFPVDPEAINAASLQAASASDQSRQLPVKERTQTVRDLIELKESNNRLTPSERRAAYRQYNAIKEANEALQVTGPQQRRYLTDPPTRFTTPSENAAFGVRDDQATSEAANRCDLMDEAKREEFDCP